MSDSDNGSEQGDGEIEGPTVEPQPTSLQVGLVPHTLSEAVTMARIFARSALISRSLSGRPADVFATIMAGLELGLAPMASLRLIHIIKGKPALAADAMVALCLSRGAAQYFIRIDSTDERATYETKRRGQPKQRATFTIAQAQRAHLLDKKQDKDDGGWQKYPDAMLRARAKSALARDVYPDVLAGIYTPEELEGGVIDVEVDDVDVKPPPTEESTPRDPSAEAAIAERDVAKETRAMLTELESWLSPNASPPNAARLAELRARIEKLPDGFDRTAALSSLARLEKPRKK